MDYRQDFASACSIARSESPTGMKMFEIAEQSNVLAREAIVEQVVQTSARAAERAQQSSEIARESVEVGATGQTALEGAITGRNTCAGADEPYYECQPIASATETSCVGGPRSSCARRYAARRCDDDSQRGRSLDALDLPPDVLDGAPAQLAWPVIEQSASS